MAELADYAEDEPDMDSDPTLASCCRREIKDRRVKQGKLDAIRAGMPATVSAAPDLLGARALARPSPRGARDPPGTAGRAAARCMRPCARRARGC